MEEGRTKGRGRKEEGKRKGGKETLREAECSYRLA